MRCACAVRRPTTRLDVERLASGIPAIRPGLCNPAAGPRPPDKVGAGVRRCLGRVSLDETHGRQRRHRGLPYVYQHVSHRAARLRVRSAETPGSVVGPRRGPAGRGGGAGGGARAGAGGGTRAGGAMATADTRPQCVPRRGSGARVRVREARGSGWSVNRRRGTCPAIPHINAPAPAAAAAAANTSSRDTVPQTHDPPPRVIPRPPIHACLAPRSDRTRVHRPAARSFSGMERLPPGGRAVYPRSRSRKSPACTCKSGTDRYHRAT